MMNDMLIREKFMEMVNQLNVILEYIKESKEERRMLKKEITTLKRLAKKINNANKNA